jgi:hypothetical protein
MAVAAKLFIVAAGDAAVIEACKPLFDALGQRTFPIGAEPAATNLVLIPLRLTHPAAQRLIVQPNFCDTD